MECKRRALLQLQAALTEEKSKRNVQKAGFGETESYLTVISCLLLSGLCFFGRLQKLMYHATSTETATEAFHLLCESFSPQYSLVGGLWWFLEEVVPTNPSYL
jgi:hypothetical protein